MLSQAEHVLLFKNFPGSQDIQSPTKSHCKHSELQEIMQFVELFWQVAQVELSQSKH